MTKIKIDKNGKVGFVFSTYDGTSFLWPDFFRLLNRFWPGFDTAFDGYISMAEKKEIIASDKLVIQPIGLSNSNSTYSERLLECINRLNCEYVFIILDDYYVKSTVDNTRFAETLDFIRNNTQIDGITYENFRSTSNKAVQLSYLRYLKKRMFLCNLQIGLWRSSSLQKIIRLNENPWKFEYYGSVRACLFNYKILTIKQGEPPIFDYDFGWLLQRGKFDNKTYHQYVEKLGIDPKLGDVIGYHEREPAKKVGLMTKIRHAILSVLSFFRR
ncbi:MAG: hypothetical protein PHC91_03575 [Eubacteriales bacterium]|nr:hypothetical protein [Eubacteriales bacterium]